MRGRESCSQSPSPATSSRTPSVPLVRPNLQLSQTAATLHRSPVTGPCLLSSVISFSVVACQTICGPLTAPLSDTQPVLRDRMPELDTIRGMAIAGVVLYHLFYWTRDLTLYPAWQRHFFSLMAPGQFGVNLFFVLSGFLITGILLDSKSRPDYYARFYYRRALRILPAYYFTLCLLAIFGLSSRPFLLLKRASIAPTCRDSSVSPSPTLCCGRWVSRNTFIFCGRWRCGD